MTLLGTLRYVLALIGVLVYPGAVLFWYLVHPFIDFWRRLGPRLTYGILIGLWLLVAAGTWPFRDVILAVEYGTGPLLWVAAVVCYAIAALIEIRCRKHLAFPILAGVPELQTPAEGGGRLLQEGIYGRIRHPRYVSVVFATLAIAFFCNYLAVWILAAIMPFALAGVVHFEERELSRRFGAQWAEYRRRVPAFWPRRRSE